MEKCARTQPTNLTLIDDDVYQIYHTHEISYGRNSLIISKRYLSICEILKYKMTLGFCKFAKYLPDSKNKFKLQA